MKMITKQELRAINYLIDDVCNDFDIDRARLFKKSRKQPYSEIRQIVFYLANLQGISKVKIARYFSFHHSSVIYGIRHIEDLSKYDQNLALYVAHKL